MTRAALLLVLALVLASSAAADPAVTPAPLAASSIAVSADEAPAMLDRLAGQQARLIAGRLVIDDIAREGRPYVGTIERRGGDLWLITDGGAVRLAGPLARPRIAGPGYRAWATGSLTAATLRVHRLGILARPAQGR